MWIPIVSLLFIREVCFNIAKLLHVQAGIYVSPIMLSISQQQKHQITKCRFQNQINHFGSITQWDVHRNSHIGESDNLLHILFVKCS